MDIYSLSRAFWDFSFENPDKVRPNHISIYFFAIEHCNRLGWKQKFGLPTSMVMEAIGVKSYNTYAIAFKDLVDWGFFELVQKSKNQYSSNIIALSKNGKAPDKAPDKALDKALIKHGTKHGTKQSESTGESIDSIDIQYTNLQSTNKQGYKAPLSDVEKPLSFDQPQDSERCRKAINLIAAFFNLSEIRTQRNYMLVGNFVRYLEGKNRLDELADQFTAYRKIKEKEPKFKHNFQNYIGTPEERYEDGIWCSKDWAKTLNESEKTGNAPAKLSYSIQDKIKEGEKRRETA